ncbi:S-layer homology domain-containing protein [Oceanotoga sp. DSM 15011]|uniref:S-layer family protein n=1 Tax=Oceanotoga teriensis TaxID=515440 RepID=A0AA45C5V9_9BACT|nr:MULTISPECIES: S-layer homology domain-containing protein [Oceanotoga]MDN5341676.1 hypothetical protein [Oceanotoga sp.]MDO7977430.1 S-layer homology domain-containing protein [Oceanotoga teriensis]PWJ89618.1 S-layer family protein [Oceanotoga teriensis]UYO98888.1 S-layer homology domain-containing protein [Oceanotoga sp. DSM 15011]
MKKLLIITMVLTLAFGSAFAQTFKDVPVNHWAYDAVQKISSIGILEGYPDGTFKGMDTVNRYQLTLTVSRTIDYTQQNLIAPLAEKISQLDKKVSSMSSGNTSSASNSEVNALSVRVNKVENSLNQLQSSYELLSYATVKIDELESKVKDMTNSSINQDSISNINTRLARMENENNALLENIQNLSSANTSIQSKLNNVSNETYSNQKEIERINTLLSNLNSKIDMKSDSMSISDVQSKIKALENSIVDIDTNRKDISNIKSSLNTVQSSVDELSKEVEANKKAVAESGNGGVDILDILISVVISAGVAFAFTQFIK